MDPSASLTSTTGSGSVTSKCASSCSPSASEVLLSESDSVIFQPGSSTKLQSLVVIDETHRFCSVCLQKVLDSIAKSGRLALNERESDNKRIDLNSITKYSLSTSSSTFRTHLLDKHDIRLKSAKVTKRSLNTVTVTNDNSQQIQSSFFGLVAARQKVTSVNAEMMIWFALDLQSFSAVYDESLKCFFFAEFALCDTTCRINTKKVNAARRLHKPQSKGD